MLTGLVPDDTSMEALENSVAGGELTASGAVGAGGVLRVDGEVSAMSRVCFYLSWRLCPADYNQ
jgi:hypothetical protein